MEVRIDTEALKDSAEDMALLRKKTLQLEDVLNQLIRLNSEVRVYYLCCQKVAKLTYCFEMMSQLLFQISYDAEETIRQVRELMAEYRYQSES